MKVGQGTSQGNYEHVPQGSHSARCIKVIDLGTQEKSFKGKDKQVHQVLIQWEIPDIKMTDGEKAGQPMVISKFYTASLGTAEYRTNLFKDLTAWRGKSFTDAELNEFELKNILGAACLLSVVVNEKKRANVDSIMSLPKGMTVAKPTNALVSFSIDEFNQEVFDSLSAGVKAIIEQSPEYKAVHNGVNQDASPAGGDDFDDEIPF